MKFAVVTEYYPTSLGADVRGGIERVALTLSHALAERHDVTVIAAREGASPLRTRMGAVEVLRPGPQLRYRQAGGLSRRLGFVLAARRVVLELAPDLVLAESFLAHAVALLLPGPLRQRTVLHYADAWTGEWIRNVGLATGLAGEAVERLVFRRSWRAFLAMSDATRAKLLQRGVADGHIHVQYPDIDIDALAEVAPERFASPTIVTVARFVAYKRVADVIRAFARVRASCPDARLVLIGSGPLEHALRSLCRDAGVSEATEFRGFVREHRRVVAAIKGARVFCLPSAVEGFGIVSAEALACGTPYVSSDIPATREVTAGQGGILYPVGDVGALADGLRQVLSAPAYRSTLHESAVRRARVLHEKTGVGAAVALLERLAGAVA